MELEEAEREYYELLQFLLECNLSHLYSSLTEQGISLEILAQANETELSILVPKLNEKIKLRVALQKWNDAENKHSEVATVIFLPDTGATPATEKGVVLAIGTENNSQESVLVEKDENPNTDLNDLGAVVGSTLRKLLLSTTQGKALLQKSIEKEALNSKERAFLAKTIVEVELKSLQGINNSIRKNVWQKWATEVGHIFKESPDLYYVPYKTVDGKIIQASGLFQNRLITHRRLLSESSRKRDSSSESSSSNSSPRVKKRTKQTLSRVRPLPADYQIDENATNDDTSTAQECFNWLKSSSSPMDMVEEKWTQTLKIRNEFLSTLSSYQNYFETFPCLTLPKGFNLLKSDFNKIYPEAKKNFEENFPLVKGRTLQLLADKTSNITKPDKFATELLELASLGEEQSNLATFLAIVILMRQMPVVNVPKKKLWKLSRDEVRNGFIYRVPKVSDIDRHCTEREALIISKGIPEQPYIIAVGTTWGTIIQYELVMYKGMRFQFPDICSVITNAYRIYWALDCAYPRDSASCWMFIQKTMFKMNSKYDSEGVPLRELLATFKSHD